MRPRSFLTAALLCLFAATLARADQPVKDPAELLPAETLAVAELRQPGALLKELASLFEGTLLGNVPDSLAKLWAAEEGGGRGPRRQAQPTMVMGGLGLFLSPEMIKEAGRVQ